MKTSLYFNYTTRSLLRGGQRTVLAVFCVAVGIIGAVGALLAMVTAAFVAFGAVRVRPLEVLRYE